MRISNLILKPAVAAFFATGVLAFPTTLASAQEVSTVATQQSAPKILSAEKINATTVRLQLSNQQQMLLDFYGSNIFRMFQDNSGKGMREPEAKPEAHILVKEPRKPVGNLQVTDNNGFITIATSQLQIEFDKNSTLFKIKDLSDGKVVVQELDPISFSPKQTTLTLAENPDEYFYGGGIQNGRFSHRGEMIKIENENSWTDGGVASPTPFYWSSNGYGLMWYTFKPGRYDFGAKKPGEVLVSHETPYLDVFFMVNEKPVNLLRDFYQLTGDPVLLPKFGFYEGHLNAYNRDYWKENPKGILFEDGKRYVESQKDNGGIKESLNGNSKNYQFSARAVVDRYARNNMPLGWILPNDGYGAGYGQANTLDGNIANLKSFGDYSREHGVQIGLWTQSDLHPKPGVKPLLQRDIDKEIGVAGVRVLKTDVAWVGDGYSFGLHGISDVAHLMPELGQDARPFIITLDGWAGTQRYAGEWTGDQTGGKWEYIRFHIPTYLGSGLSGQPNITSDMDGIFGGKNPVVNTRDYQWKTFTPMQLNMDGWGLNPKYPMALGEPVTSINRDYLKFKSELLPYLYTIAHDAVTGLPMIRAVFLDDPNAYTLGKSTEYEFMFGPDFLIAPIYQDTEMDQHGNDIRNTIYLPKGLWVDYFTGQQYKGGQIINNFDAPLWKLPVFVKRGAIIPMVNPNNDVSQIKKDLRIYQIYPYGDSSFTQYDDDGTTIKYLSGQSVKTTITSSVDKKNNVTISIEPTKGNYDGFVKEQKTIFKINVTKEPSKIKVEIGKKNIRLKKASSLADFEKGEDIYYYDPKPNFNRFATVDSAFAQVQIIRNPQLLVKLQKTDITKEGVSLKVKGFIFAPEDQLLQKTGPLTAPQNVTFEGKDLTPYSVNPTWKLEPDADYYEIEFENQLYSTITQNHLWFENLTPQTKYDFKIRAVNKTGKSQWTNFSATTHDDPFMFAIKGITGSTSTASQDGTPIKNLFDGDQSDMWHSKWDQKAVPFDVIVDLKSVNVLDKMEYFPRTSGINGTWEQGTVYYSNDKQNWIKAGDFEWSANSEVKTFDFASHPTAGYIKISVTKAGGDFGSGRELYVFRVPGTNSYLPGDINNDRLVDGNDLTSYMNYMGLRKGDADFEGYVSQGDVNKNGRIDAYDISVVATKIHGGVSKEPVEKVSGTLQLSVPRTNFKKGEIVPITVRGVDLKSVNALGFTLPYSDSDYEFVGIEPLNMQKMEDYTKDRLHTDGEKDLYPTFVNIGNQPALSGSQPLFIIKLKARHDLKYDLKPRHFMLVDKDLRTDEF